MAKKQEIISLISEDDTIARPRLNKLKIKIGGGITLKSPEIILKSKGNNGL